MVGDEELGRRLTWREYREALDIVEELPFEHLFLQEDLADSIIPPTSRRMAAQAGE